MDVDKSELFVFKMSAATPSISNSHDGTGGTVSGMRRYDGRFDSEKIRLSLSVVRRDSSWEDDESSSLSCSIVAEVAFFLLNFANLRLSKFIPCKL